MDQRSEADLIWYFSVGLCMFSRSTLGGMLERAEAMRFDSGGRRIPAAQRDAWNVVPIAHTRSEPSYTPDDAALVRVAGVSRRLRRLGRDQAIVIQAYYGDIGERWGRTKAGRIFALYALTDAGQVYCDEAARKDSEYVRADERIAALAAAQRRAARKERKVLLRAMHEQAERLLASAWAAWAEVSGAA